MHRLDVARELSTALPDARLLDAAAEGGVFWTAGRAATDALAAHLSGELA